MKPFDIDLYQPEAVIVANGEFPSASVMHRWIDRAPLVVCLDGAANRLLQLGYRPHLIIGDGDSIQPGLTERYGVEFLKVDEQETNDLSKAVRYLHRRGCRQLMMLGITGRRDDHTLGNISLLVYYLQMGMKAVAVTDWGTFVPCRGNALLKTTKGQQVSLFNFRATGIKSNDLVYPPYDTTMLWQGTLNEATSDRLSIQAEGDYLVYLVNMQQAPPHGITLTEAMPTDEYIVSKHHLPQ